MDGVVFASRSPAYLRSTLGVGERASIVKLKFCSAAMGFLLALAVYGGNPGAAKATDTVVFALAEDAYRGNAQYAITVDGVQVATGCVENTGHSGQSQRVTVQVSSGVMHMATVTFLNDAYGGSSTADRNLYINSITYHGAAVPASDYSLGGYANFTGNGVVVGLYVTGDSVTVTIPPPTPPSGPQPPQAAVDYGLTTLALNSDFTELGPLSSWFGCRGSGPGYTWYQSNEGGDYGTPVPCSNNGRASRFNLVTDSMIGKQVFDLTFLPSDIADGRHYTAIQTEDDSTIPPTKGVGFPYSFYMEATYRIQNTPAVPFIHMGGAWWAFWQAGEGVYPSGGRWNTMEIDHPEQHGEWPEIMDWCAINWATSSSSYFNYSDPYGTLIADGVDFTQYHTFGVLVTTDGSTGWSVCGYLDNVNLACNWSTVGLTDLLAPEYYEPKFPILFAGFRCYFFPFVSSNCVNIPISTIYNCNGQVCVHADTAITEQNFWPVWMSISGVTGMGADGVNGQWQVTPVSWNNGATDWVLTGSTFAGTPTGGTINPTSQLDLFVQSVHVWTCANAGTSPCFVSLPF
jgi:hypothetical protein